MRRMARRRGAGLASAIALATGLAALPIGSAELRAQASSAASRAPEHHSPTATRALSRRGPTEIDAAGRRYAGAVRSCYEQEGLKHDPTLRGRLRVALTVLPAGDVRAPKVTAARVQGVGIGAVASCVAAAAGSWHFPSGEGHPERVVLWFELLPSD